MTKSAALTAFEVGFQCCPIILNDGVAKFLGGMLPIIALTEAANFIDGILSGGDITDPSQFFAHFMPVPGSNLISNKYGTYPFANQTVAANAVIAEPLRLSLRMTCPARNFAAKLATITALKAVLEQHSNLGGTYTVITPSYFLTSCLLTDLIYEGDSGNTQKQSVWRWDFIQPLLTEAAASAVYNGMMTLLNNLVPSTGALSGTEVVNASLLSMATGQFVPAASISPASVAASGIPQ